MIFKMESSTARRAVSPQCSREGTAHAETISHAPRGGVLLSRQKLEFLVGYSRAAAEPSECESVLCGPAPGYTLNLSGRATDAGVVSVGQLRCVSGVAALRI